MPAHGGTTLKLTPIQSVTVVRSEPGAARGRDRVRTTGNAPPKHFHPEQDERFEVLEGSLRVNVDGEERDLAGRDDRDSRGGPPDVEPGRRASEVRWQTMPAGRTEQFFSSLDQLNREQRLEEFPSVVQEFEDTFVLVWE